MGVLEAAIGQAKVVEPMRERRTSDGHTVIRHVGEIGQPDATGLVDLPEDHLLIRPSNRAGGQRPPLPNPTLEGAPHPPPWTIGAELGMAAQQFLENGDRPQPWRGLQ